MEADGIISRQRGDDGRKTVIHLTVHGEELLLKLDQHWEATFATIEQLEHEVGHPIRQVLLDTARLLEQRGFSQRLSDLKRAMTAGVTADE
ncbi:hypothetical protein D3C80_1081170 [compost metagenome]